MATLASLLSSRPVPNLSFLNDLPGQAAGSNPMAQVSNASGMYTNATDPDLLAQLAKLRQFDPNASVATGHMGDQDGGSPAFSLSYDPSKLPALPTDAQGTFNRVPDAGWNSRQLDHSGSDAILHNVINPALNVDSAYGALTPSSNLTTKHVSNPDTSLLSRIGPMIPLLAAGGVGMLGGATPGFGGLTAGGVLSGGGELGAAAGVNVGSSALGSSLTKFAEGVPGQLNSGKFNPMSAAGPLAQMAGIPSWLIPILNMARGGASVNPATAGMTLAGLLPKGP